MAKHPHLAKGGAQPASSEEAEPSYRVGYGRTPVHGRFKPGHPKRGGRRKGQRNRRTVVDEVLNQKITIREGNRTRSVTKFEAMILQITNEALSGNAKAQANLIALVRSLDLMGGPVEATNTEPLTSDDPSVISDFLDRVENQAEPTRCSGSDEKRKADEPEPSKEIKEKKS